MKRIIFIALVFLIIQITAFPQKENWVWYHGGGAISFNTPDTLPIYIFDFPRKESDISITVCDKDAKLLFYSTGDSTWNKKHQLMPNGSINGVYCNMYPLVAINLGIKKEYVLLNYYSLSSNSKLIYSIINMDLDNGLGDVKIKNVLLDSNVNFYNIVYHPNGIDLWIITFSYFDSFFKAFLMTKDGIVTSPVISKGIKRPHFTDSKWTQKWMMVAPDNKKIVLFNSDKRSIFDDTLKYMDLYYFDNRTGKIKFITNILDSNFNGYIGTLEHNIFSSNSKFLYLYVVGRDLNGLDRNMHHYLFQYYFEEKDTTLLITKKIVYDSIAWGTVVSVSSFWLAPNRKLYFRDNSPYYLGEISFPDSIGTKCSFNPKANRTPFRYPPRMNAYFPCYYCFYASAKQPVCEGDTIFFEGSVSGRFVNPEFYWTGPNGFSSTERNPIIPNAEKRHSGLYRLTAKADTTILYDTVYVNIFDRQTAKIKAKESLQLCRNGTIELESEIKDRKINYLWSNGKTTDKIIVNKGGIYKLIITNENGCVGIDSVKVLDPPSVIILSDKTGLCYGQTAILKFNSDSPINNFRWSNGSTDSSIQITLPGKYKLYYEYGECKDSSEMTIEDYGRIGARIEGESIVCKGDSVWLRALPQGYNYKYLWSNGSRDYEIKVSGNQSINVIVENQNGCKDTAYFELQEIPSTEAKIKGGTGICSGQKKILKAEPNNDIYDYKMVNRRNNKRDNNY